MQRLLQEIEQRLSGLFRRLSEGDDAPPSMVLRLEGLMEAAAILEQATPEALQELINAAHTTVNGESLDIRLGADWRRRYPFPQLPVIADRAPVYPSTKD